MFLGHFEPVLTFSLLKNLEYLNTKIKRFESFYPSTHNLFIADNKCFTSRAGCTLFAILCQPVKP